MNTTNNNIVLCIATTKITFDVLMKKVMSTKKNNLLYAMNVNDIAHLRSVLDLCGAKSLSYNVKYITLINCLFSANI